ncbi:MAG: mercury methylation corrinoid protein HgcA [bacterium]
MIKIPAKSCIRDGSGKVPVVDTVLKTCDYLGAVKARLNIGRMNYSVKPGLYAVGSPEKDSPVLVSANYKMSFDWLRRGLGGINAWIMVLDTKGINVWCAAGKGTFGTDEIINRIRLTRLTEIVSHRLIILPQLGAPGAAAHKVKKETGFGVRYGPVRSADIPEFLSKGMKTSPEMRSVKFNFLDRLVLVPLEVIMSLKIFVLVSALLFILAGFSSSGYSASMAMEKGLLSIMLFTSALISGAVFGPLLLPLIPGRAFSLKGFITGITTAFIIVGYYFARQSINTIEAAAWFLAIPAVSSYLTMNFTGASTYTSLSGVKKEMRMALPVQITLTTAGAVIWVIARFFRG